MLWSRVGLNLPLKGWLEREKLTVVNQWENKMINTGVHVVGMERRESSQGNLEKLGKVSSSRWILSLKE